MHYSESRRLDGVERLSGPPGGPPATGIHSGLVLYRSRLLTEIYSERGLVMTQSHGASQQLFGPVRFSHE